MPLPLAVLEDDHVVLEPLQRDHMPGLETAAADGELWNLWFTSAPAPGKMAEYVDKALTGHQAGLMLPFAVREKRSGEIAGTTRFYDYVDDPRRVAIGYSWYAKRWQKSHVNTACKRLLLKRAIERLGAVREGVLRNHKRRPDGSLRDTVCYSILDREWADVEKWLSLRLERLVSTRSA